MTPAERNATRRAAYARRKARDLAEAAARKAHWDALPEGVRVAWAVALPHAAGHWLHLDDGASLALFGDLTDEAATALSLAGFSHEPHDGPVRASWHYPPTHRTLPDTGVERISWDGVPTATRAACEAAERAGATVERYTYAICGKPAPWFWLSVFLDDAPPELAAALRAADFHHVADNSALSPHSLVRRPPSRGRWEFYRHDRTEAA